MFFILNSEKTVLVADEAFLEHVGTSNIFLLAERFRFGDFQLDEENQTCRLNGTLQSFTTSPIQAILGAGTLYQIMGVSAESDRAAAPIDLPKDPALQNELRAPLPDTDTPHFTDTMDTAEDYPEADTATFSPEETLYPFPEKELDPLPAPPTTEFEQKSEETSMHLLDDTPVPPLSGNDQEKFTLNVEEAPPSAPSVPGREEDSRDLFEIGDDTMPPISTREADTPRHEDEAEDLLDLLDLGNDDQESAAPTPPAEAKGDDEIFALVDQKSDLESDIPPPPGEEPPSPGGITSSTYQIGSAPFADYTANAQIIGITAEEYLGFLQQFVDESFNYEAGLKSHDSKIFKKLISIKDASQLLHLPQLSETLGHLEEAPLDDRAGLIDRFYGMTAHLHRDLGQSSPGAPHTQSASPSVETHVDIPSEHPAPPSPKAPDIPSISLDTVDTVPFDFSTRAASDELGLPETLVQEFVSDFIQQAKEDIAVFEEAQHTNDIDTIQKTAHLLKGAASNLRIDPLAETLKTLQYNETPEKVPKLLQTFVGQLKALILFTENPAN